MYFSELRRRYINKWWYYVGRGLFFIILSIIILIFPQTDALIAILPFAGGMILDGLLLLLPILTGKSTRQLRRIILPRGVLQITLGLIILFNTLLSVALMMILLGGLLVFRGCLETISFVESSAQVRHQRLALLSAFIALFMGVMLIVAPFLLGAAVRLALALYIFLVGILALLTGWRIHQAEPQPVAESTLLGELDHAKLARHASSPSRRRRAIPKIHRQPDFLELPLMKYSRAVVFTPHPDDLEGFAGGLVYQLTAPVTSVIYAGGNLGVWNRDFARLTSEEYIDIRLDESVEAGHLLGVDEIIYMGYRDRQVYCHEDTIEQTLTILRDIQPDLVISFEYRKWATPYIHPDHLAVACAVHNAMARYEAHDSLDYVVTSTLLPNRFVDISKVRRVKLEALACHRTQSTVNAAIFPFFEKLLVSLWGAYTGVRFAEGYRQINTHRLKARSL